MRVLWHFAVGLIGLVLVTSCRADTPDLLRLIPEEADLLVKVEQPRAVVENLLNHPLVNDLYHIDSVRDLYNSTNVRRFSQLVAYFEKELGAKRFELLDRLAGGGA